MESEPKRPYYIKPTKPSVYQKLDSLKQSLGFGTATILPNWEAGYTQALVTTKKKK